MTSGRFYKKYYCHECGQEIIDRTYPKLAKYCKTCQRAIHLKRMRELNKSYYQQEKAITLAILGEYCEVKQDENKCRIRNFA